MFVFYIVEPVQKWLHEGEEPYAEMEETEGEEDFKQEVGLFICGVVDFESCKVLKWKSWVCCALKLNLYECRAIH